MVAKTKAKTTEKLLSQLSGAEAANRKHKARIAELEKETQGKGEMLVKYERALLKALDVKDGGSPHAKVTAINNALAAVA